jgi:ATP/maltotriose-dependent transcriptional regulator MalT
MPDIWPCARRFNQTIKTPMSTIGRRYMRRSGHMLELGEENLRLAPEEVIAFVSSWVSGTGPVVV